MQISEQVVQLGQRIRIARIRRGWSVDVRWSGQLYANRARC